MYAFSELYIGNWQRVMGTMLDYAVHEMCWKLGEFYSWFLISDYAGRAGHGDCGVIAGKSGIELAWDVYYAVCKSYPELKAPEEGRYLGKTPEYWTGWALAYYQWESGIPFEEIECRVGIETVRDMYDVYHEMDVRQFSDRMNILMQQEKPADRLKKYRRLAGYTQRLLAERSGVSVRTIQQYEQGQKDLRKAQAEAAISIAKALGCSAEELCR